MAGPKAKSLRSVVVVILIGGIWAYFALFGEEPPPPQQQARTPPATTAPRTAPKQAPPSLDLGAISTALESGIWPPAAGEDQVLGEVLVDNYLIILDKSGSMEKSQCSGNTDKFTVARQAVQFFVDGLPAEAGVGLILFSSSVDLAVPLGGGNREAFRTAIRRARTGGKTALRASLVHGWEVLTRQAQAQSGYGTYRMIVITDGASSDGNPADLAKSIVAGSSIALSVIGFCLDGGHSLDVAGYTSYTTANNPEELARSLKAVRAEVTAFDAATFQPQRP
jgi:hypothetical protein